MLRRRLMMQSGGVRLPSKYREVEYLETIVTDQKITPIINTGVMMKDGAEYGIYIDVEPTNYVNMSSIWIFGNFIAGSSYCWRIWGNATYKFGLYLNNSKQIVLGENTLGRRKISVNLLDGVYINGEKKHDGKLNLISNDYLYLFGCKWVQTGFEYVGSSQRVYECYITRNGETIRNFVPCYRKADHKPGMYDIVNGVFHTNKGTGEFIVAPVVN